MTAKRIGGHNPPGWRVYRTLPSLVLTSSGSKGVSQRLAPHPCVLELTMYINNTCLYYVIMIVRFISSRLVRKFLMKNCL